MGTNQPPLDAVQAIQAMMANLSPASRGLAEYLLTKPDKACFLNASELARETGVSHASVVRFAKLLGYSGYPEFQKAFQSRVARRLTTVERMEGLPATAQQNLFAQQMRADLANLSSTVQELDAADGEQASAWLAGARTIFVIGLRSTASLAELAVFALRTISTGSQVVALSATEYFEQLAAADERDVLLGFSFPRYFRSTVEIMQHAHAKGVRCIAVTDSLASPLAQTAQITLPCRVEMHSFIESFVAPLSLVNALVTNVALRNREAALQRLSDLEKVWEANDIYYSKERRSLYGSGES